MDRQLFRSENKTRTKTNLMVFLRPVIMRDQATSTQIATDRYDYLRQQQYGSTTDNRLDQGQGRPDDAAGADRAEPGRRARAESLQLERHDALADRQHDAAAATRTRRRRRTGAQQVPPDNNGVSNYAVPNNSVPGTPLNSGAGARP